MTVPYICHTKSPNLLRLLRLRSTLIEPSTEKRNEMSNATPKKKHTGWKIAGGIVALLIVISAFSGGGKDTTTETADTTTATPETAAVTTAPKVVKPKLTAGQENAIGSAENYIGMTAFSRKGLITQLKFESYSTADATFAVDHIKADWNEQAVLAAQKYLDMTSFSRGGLITQLKFDGFTDAQATHGVTGAGL